MNRKYLFWVKDNFFNTWYNTIITVFLCLFLSKTLRALSEWLFSSDWRVIPTNIKIILTGAYPPDQLWRIWLILYFAGLMAGLSFCLLKKGLKWTPLLLITAPSVIAGLISNSRASISLLILSIVQISGYCIGKRMRKKAVLVSVFSGWTIFIPLMYLLTSGFSGPDSILPLVKTNLWGGLLLSMIISITSIILSFITGLFLALGRRSKLPVIRYFSIAVIETVRGVPLITLLFLGYLILPLALPSSMTLGVLLRAMSGIILFHAAYMAENIRGGFQGLSKTQYEAAYAMNFSSFQSMVLIILPQVIKNIIPVLVNSFTGMVKDTSLISIIGLLDLVGISTAIAANPEFMKDSQQTLLFLSLIYFILCYSISRTSRKIEASMNYNNREI